MTILAQTLGGLFWAYGAMGSERLLGLLTTALLARMLYPSDFGVLALAFIVLGYIDTLRDFGIKDALIYMPDRRDGMIGTAATMGLLIGVIQCVAGLLLAPLATFVIDDHRVVLLIQVLSLTFIINALSLAQDGLLQKHLSFKGRFYSDFGGAAAKAIVTVLLALTGSGIWALAAGHLVGTITRGIIRFIAAATPLTFRYERGCASELWSFGKHILFVNIVGTVLTRADQIAVAFFIGASALGYYFIASRIPDLVVGSLSMVLTLVLFPVFAKLKEDSAQLRSAFLDATRFTALIAVPISAGFMAVAPELVTVAFGERWLPSAPMLEVLAAVSLVAALGWNAGDLFKAIGRPDLQSRLVSIEAAVAIPLVFLLASWTQTPALVAVGYLLGVSASTIGRIWLASRMLQLRTADLARLYGPSVAGGVGIIAVTLLSRPLIQGAGPLSRLAVLSLVGAGVYFCIIWWLDNGSIRTALAVSRSLIRSRSQWEMSPGSPIGKK